MRLNLIFLILGLIAENIDGATNIVGPEALAVDTDTVWMVPTANGGFEMMNYMQYLQQLDLFKSCKEFVYAYIYNRNDPKNPVKINIDSPTALNAAKFNSDIPIYFIVHGWRHSCANPVNVLIGGALLDTRDCMVICIDWSTISKTINYPIARKCVSTVGERVAKFVDYLCRELGVDINLITLIGHSLGAHICGFIGKSVESGKIQTICGLDPASPLFFYEDRSTRLSSTDAVITETIQTNGDQLGFAKPIGTAAYYPNGGKRQPACGLLDPLCSHEMSINYLSEAIYDNSFFTCKVDSYQDLNSYNCPIANNPARMGFLNNYNITGGVSGIFYVPVNKQSPYGKGV